MGGPSRAVRPRFILTHGEAHASEGLRAVPQSRLGTVAECPGPGEIISLE